MLALAIWLTRSPEDALRTVRGWAAQLAEGGRVEAGVGAWIQHHLSQRTVAGGAVLAWLDMALTTGAALLLWSGRTWAEWTVTIGLACLLPLEAASLARSPSGGTLGVIVVNAAVVAYLARRRLRASRERRAHPIVQNPS